MIASSPIKNKLYTDEKIEYTGIDAGADLPGIMQKISG
jgi:hypothetical protein